MKMDGIKDTVRLINMGFHSLFKEMSIEVKTLNIHTVELLYTVKLEAKRIKKPLLE